MFSFLGNRSEHQPKGTYFYRIYLLFLLFLIPIIIIGVLSYYYLKQSVTREINQYNLNVLNSTVSVLENEFKELKNLSYQLSQNPSLMNSLTQTSDISVNDIFSLRDINKFLVNVQSVKENVDSSFIFIPNKNVLLSNDGLYDFVEYFNHFYRYEKYGPDYWKNIGKSDEYFKVLETVKVYGRGSDAANNGSYENVVPFIVNLRGYVGSKGVMVINIKEKAIRELISNYRSYPENEIFIFDSEGSMISHTGDKIFSTDDCLKLMNLFDNNGTDGKRITFQNNKYILFEKKFSFPDWYVVSIIPRELAYQKSDFILKTLVLINLFNLLFWIVIATIFSSKLYDPINNFINIIRGSSTGDVKNSKIKEIRFIYENLDFLQKSKNDLNSKVSIMKPYAQERMFQNIIFGNELVNQPEIIELFQNDKKKFTKKYYLLSLFYLTYGLTFDREYNEKVRMDAKYGMRCFIKDMLMQKFEDCVFIDLESERFCVVIYIDDLTEKEAFLGIVKEISKFMEGENELVRLYIAFANEASQLLEISELYWKLHEVLEHIDLGSSKILYGVDDLNYDASLYFPRYIEQKLTNLILDNDKQGISQTINELFEENFKVNVFKDHLRKIVMKICDVCEKTAAEQNISTNKLNVDKDFRLFSLNETKQVLLDLIFEISESISEKTVKRKDVIMEYIICHCMDENMCLDKIAGDLKLNPAYLSRLFKEITGQNFLDYIAIIRVEKIKNMLLNTDMSIDEIGLAVGIPSRSTFNRVFKKHEGVSPGTYRDINS